MGISKADILNADSTIQTTQGDDDGKLAGVGSAVKLALAETAVIAETKAYFEEHGVVLDRLSETTDTQGKPKRTPRSRTMLLVKNIPYGTDVTLLTGLFEPHGAIRRLLLPPAGTLAVVEYENEDDAARAFRAVNYRRLGSAVVYLEKAPEGLIDEERPTAPDARQAAKAPETEADIVKQRVEAVGSPEDNAPAEAGSTLFVKNLSFTTTTERLQSVFSSLPAYSFARVSTKPDPKNPTGPRLSMGFGFLGFATWEAAAKAMQGLKGLKLDGHDLDFKYAMRDAGDEARESKADAVPGKAKNKTTKMIVKNVPFEASKKDIRDLFRYVLSPRRIVTTLISSQRIRDPQILPNTEKAQFDRSWIRFPRLYNATRSRGRHERPQAHAFARQTSGTRMGGDRWGSGCAGGGEAEAKDKKPICSGRTEWRTEQEEKARPSRRR